MSGSTPKQHEALLTHVIAEAMTCIEHNPTHCLHLADELQVVDSSAFICAWQQLLRGIAEARRNPTTAQPQLEQAYVYAQQCSDGLLHALLHCLSLCYLGAIAADKGKPQMAFELSYKALTLCKEYDFYHYTILVARLCTNIAASYTHRSLFHQAFKYHLKAFEIYQKHHAELVYRTLGNLALMQHRLGYTDKAERNYVSALKLAKKADDTLATVIVGINLAIMYHESKIMSKSVQVCMYLRTVIGKNQAYRHLQTDIFNILGSVYTRQGKFDKALLWYRKAMQNLKQYPSDIDATDLYYSMGEYYVAIKQPSRAFKVFYQSLKYADRMQRGSSQKKVHKALARLYAEQSDYRAAYQHLERCHVLNEQLFREDVKANAQTLVFMHELKMAQRERDIIARKNNELEKLNQQLAAANERLSVASISDVLTKAYNRRYLEERLHKEFAHAAEEKLPISAILCDLDRFKRLNDNFSHAIGDKVLQHFSQLLQKTVRMYDTVARYGGEEFVILLPATTLHDALELAEKIRLATFDYPWRNIHPDLMVTISAGVASGTEYGTGDKLLDAADKQLHAAKYSGRNCVASILTPKVLETA